MVLKYFRVNCRVQYLIFVDLHSTCASFYWNLCHDYDNLQQKCNFKANFDHLWPKK